MLDTFFWFQQPSIFLNNFDYLVAFLGAGSLLAGFLFWIAQKFVKHTIVKKLINKFKSLLVGLSVPAIIWFGFRYENTPIFGRRFWLLLIMGIFVVWFLFIIKYLFFRFLKEKREYDAESVKRKYLEKK